MPRQNYSEQEIGLVVMILGAFTASAVASTYRSRSSTVSMTADQQ